MSAFTLTKMAKTDLKDIGRYTKEHWGGDQRNKYLTMLNNCFEQLAENPLKGRECGDIRRGYRKMQVGSHIIFYRQSSEKTVEIIRVLHARMDVENQLASS